MELKVSITTFLCSYVTAPRMAPCPVPNNSKAPLCSHTTSDWAARMVASDSEVFLSCLNNSKWDLSLAGDSFDDAGNIIEHTYCFAAKANDFSIVESKNQFVSKWSRYDSKEAEGHWEVQHIVSFLLVTAFITKQQPWGATFLLWTS